jgi:hypothetical protein
VQIQLLPLKTLLIICRKLPANSSYTKSLLLAGVKVIQNVRRSKALNKINIQSDLTINYCSNNCTENCSQKLDAVGALDMVIRWRQRYHLLKQGPEQQNMLLSMLQSTLMKHDKKRTWYHMVDGIRLCRFDYILLYIILQFCLKICYTVQPKHTAISFPRGTLCGHYQHMLVRASCMSPRAFCVMPFRNFHV